MLRNRSSKIVATVGPSCKDRATIEKIFKAGVDVFRLNFSHGTHESHAKEYDMIREIGRKYGAYPAILADLQGPKLRIGNFENSKILLEEGNTFVLDLDDAIGDSRRVNLPHPEILQALKVGSTLLLDDGKIRLEVKNCSPDFAEVNVLVGGILSDHKGVNVPDVLLPIPALTPKDRQDLNFALELGVDWIALSFVQSVNDVEEARQIIQDKALIMSKLEKPMAIRDMDAIIEASDGVMVARGDLGVEMDLASVPVAQKQIIATARRFGRPVVVATQMLESMITMPTATRAEVSDIAHAIYDGADATMLSAESASGKYCVESVELMNKVIETTEADPDYMCSIEDVDQYIEANMVDSLCIAAADAAECIGASAIVVQADSIEQIARCSNVRSICPILCVASSSRVAAAASMFRGIFATVEKKEFAYDKLQKKLGDLTINLRYAKTGEYIVILDLVSTHSISVCKL